MGKRNIAVLAAGMGIGGVATYVLRHAGDGLDAIAGWIGCAVLLGCGVFWMRHALRKLNSVATALDGVTTSVGAIQRVTVDASTTLDGVTTTVGDVRNIAAATSTAVLRTSERIGRMHTELGDKITAAGERAAQQHQRAAVERAIAGSKQRQADYDEQQTGRLVEVQQTLAAMSVRLVTMANKQEAVVATLRSLPCAQAGETTLPAQGNEPSDPPSPEPVTPGGPPDMPPSGIHASSNFGSALSASLEPRSWTPDNPPPQSSAQPSERADESAADDDDATALFNRDDLPQPAERLVSDVVTSERQSTARRLKERAEARLRKARAERGEAEPPSSGE